MTQCNIPKKQHYVPQYYLRRFVDGEGKLYIVDYARKRFYRCSPKDVCEANYYYEMRATKQRSYHDKFFNPGDLEGRLSKIEQKQARLLKEIDSQSSKRFINSKESRQLIRLIAHLISRHPIMMDTTIDVDAFLLDDPELRKMYDVLCMLEMQDEFPTFIKGGYQRCLTLSEREGSFQAFIKEELGKLNCGFLKTIGASKFITAWQPASFYTSQEKDGIDHIKELFFPLSPSLAVFYTSLDHSKNEILEINDKDVTKLNAGYLLKYPRLECFISGSRMDLLHACEYVISVNRKQHPVPSSPIASFIFNVC